MLINLSSLKKILIVSILAAFIIGCAQRGNITGGERDVDPPKILKSTPENYSANYNGNSIVLEFDEIIKTNNINEQIIISPPLKKMPYFRASDKKLYIQWSDTLKPNTTYNFYFGNGIADNNEGNILDSNVFIFSTGDQLDSSSLSGIVRDAFTMEPIENASILIYKSKEDSSLYNEAPYYAANSKSDGRFMASSMKDTSYAVFALFDDNNNLTYEYSSEYVGFLDTRVNADSSNLEFFLFKEKVYEQVRLNASIINNYKWSAAYALPLQNPVISDLVHTQEDWYFTQWNKTYDSVLIYLTALPDTTRAYFTIVDESGFTDTFNISVKEQINYQSKLNNKRRRKKNDDEELVPPVLEYPSLKAHTENHSNPQRYFEPLHIHFDTPVDYVNLDSVLLIQNGDTVAFNSDKFKGTLIKNSDEDEMQPIGEASYHFILDYPWKMKSNYALYFPDSSFVDVLGRKNDSTVLSFSTQEYESYGSMVLNLNYPSEDKPPLIIQFIDDNAKVLMEYHLNGEDKIELPMHEPIKMRARAIFDMNQNGVWDTGDLSARIQPEKIEYFQEFIDIKSNWDINLTWNITTTL